MQGGGGGGSAAIVREDVPGLQHCRGSFCKAVSTQLAPPPSPHIHTLYLASFHFSLQSLIAFHFLLAHLLTFSQPFSRVCLYVLTVFVLRQVCDQTTRSIFLWRGNVANRSAVALVRARNRWTGDYKRWIRAWMECTESRDRKLCKVEEGVG